MIFFFLFFKSVVCGLGIWGLVGFLREEVGFLLFVGDIFILDIVYSVCGFLWFLVFS